MLKLIDCVRSIKQFSIIGIIFSAAVASNLISEELDINSLGSERLYIEGADSLERLPTNVSTIPPIHFLTNDLFVYIFSYLNQYSIPNVIRVSKRFKEIMENKKLWYDYLSKSDLTYSSFNITQDYKQLFKFYTTPSFTGLGHFNDGDYKNNSSYANAVSYDGLSIAGSAFDGESHIEKPFIWTQDNPKLISIFYRPTTINAISPNGQIVLGMLDNNIFIKSKNDTLTFPFNNLSHGYRQIIAMAADNNTVIGHQMFSFDHYRNITIGKAFRGKISNGQIVFLDPLNKYDSICPQSISSDGKIILGQIWDNKKRAFVWTEEENIYLLPIPDSAQDSNAENISFDGKKICGSIITGHNVGYGCSWSLKDQQWILDNVIDNLDKMTWSIFTWISTDGKTIMGNGRFLDPTKKGQEGFIWTQENGIISIHDMLNDLNVLPKGWKIVYIKDVNPKVNIIVGIGTYQGCTQAYRAVIPKRPYF